MRLLFIYHISWLWWITKSTTIVCISCTLNLPKSSGRFIPVSILVNSLLNIPTQNRRFRAATTRQHGFCPVHPSCNSVQNFPRDLNKNKTKQQQNQVVFFSWIRNEIIEIVLRYAFKIFFLSPRNQRLEILLWFKGYNWYFYFPLTWAANKCAKEGITAGRVVSVWRHKFVRLLPRTSLSAYNALQVTRTLWGNQIVWKNGWNIRLINA